VYLVEISANESQIVAGSMEGAILICTGDLVSTPLKGHTGSVRLLVISVNGDCIVLGSDDLTFGVRDIRTGQQVEKPLDHHTDAVDSVVFSSD
ncbi:hypothetical protein FA15DRAFT_549805, partial [Coprinopsis marcescibilis]